MNLMKSKNNKGVIFFFFEKHLYLFVSYIFEFDINKTY